MEHNTFLTDLYKNTGDMHFFRDKYINVGVQNKTPKSNNYLQITWGLFYK